MLAHFYKSFKVFELFYHYSYLSAPNCKCSTVTGEDTFKLHSMQLELEAVEKQIQDLLVKQAQLRERKAVLETSKADAHKSEAPCTQDAIFSGLLYSSAGTPQTLGAPTAEDASQAPDEDLSLPPPHLVLEISTRNRFAPLRAMERDAVVIGDSIVWCSVKIPAVLKGGKSIGAVMFHAGVNNIKLWQMEILKRGTSGA